jgi:hypothetical protein
VRLTTGLRVACNLDALAQALLVVCRREHAHVTEVGRAVVVDVMRLNDESLIPAEHRQPGTVALSSRALA